jgi:hypothetical protein
MNPHETQCAEAAEFVSALCDGEMIPREAAQHIGGCQLCQARLREYAVMGAELRRGASLQLLEAKTPVWQQIQRRKPSFWQKGWETVRIPRFAFAFMLIAIVALGSTLTVFKVRAHEEGSVLMLTAKTATGYTVHCALSLQYKNAGACGSTQVQNGVEEQYQFRLISKDGDRIELGVRASAEPGLHAWSHDIEKLSENPYWFQPGEPLKVDVPGSGQMTITGELLDHMPPSSSFGGAEELDPRANEIRFASPVLVKGKEIVSDFDYTNLLSTGKKQGIEVYVPHDGRYEISLSPLEGGVSGTVKESRVTFELNGQHYQFLNGAPVARDKTIWILYIPINGKDAAERGDRAGIASITMSKYLAKTSPDN